MSECRENNSGGALRSLGARSPRTFQAVLADVRTLYFVFRDPGTPWYARALLFLPLAYLCSPIQLIPNFIPGIGLLDDFLVIFLGVKLLQRIIPADVLTECREQANVAAMRRNDEIRSTATVITVLAIGLVLANRGK